MVDVYKHAKGFKTPDQTVKYLVGSMEKASITKAKGKGAAPSAEKHAGKVDPLHKMI